MNDIVTSIQIKLYNQANSNDMTISMSNDSTPVLVDLEGFRSAKAEINTVNKMAGQNGTWITSKRVAAKDITISGYFPVGQNLTDMLNRSITAVERFDKVEIKYERKTGSTVETKTFEGLLTSVEPIEEYKNFGSLFKFVAYIPNPL